MRLVALALALAAALPASAREPLRPYRLSAPIDITLVASTVTLAAVSEAIIGTDELPATTPGPKDRLLWIDRAAVDALDDPGAMEAADTRGDVVAGVASGLALAVPVITWIQDDAQEALADLTLTSEAVALTLAIGNVVKLAVRRPRPFTYVAPPAENDTDSALSFWSSHTALVASIGAVATTIAFQRHRPAWQRWVTLGLAVGLTTWVGTERVLAGKHFPTDVITGAAMGTLAGVLVPTLHLDE